MSFEALLVILFRYLHIITACVAVGGAFFMRVVLPAGLRQLEPGPGRLVLLKCRRVFKMIVHSAILLLVASGSYNAVRNWPGYSAMSPSVGHGLFGLHLLLGLISFGIALWLLAGAEPRASNRRWLSINVMVLFLTVLAASTLKYCRENAGHRPATASLDSASK